MGKSAFRTFGIFHEPRDHPRTKGFVDRLDSVFGGADSSDGYVGRAPTPREERDPRWGERGSRACFFVADQHPGRPQPSRCGTIWSLYTPSPTRCAARRSPEQAGRPVQKTGMADLGGLVGGSRLHLSPEEAVPKLKRLHDHGSTPDAFDFKTPFDAEGIRSMNRDKIWERAVVAKLYDAGNPTGGGKLWAR